MPNGLNIAGDKALIRSLQALGPKVAKKVLRGAVTAAAKPILSAAKAMPRPSPGCSRRHSARRSGRTRTAPSRPASDLARTSKASSRARSVGPWRYAHLAEKGFVNAQGEFVPPHPYLGPAADQQADEAVSVLSNKLAAGIAKAAKGGVS